MRKVFRIALLALLAMFGILLVFFFPASSGPFSVTNGPATAFRALEAAQAVFAAISALLLLAALRCVLRLESLTCEFVPAGCGPKLLALRC